jgi:hypothetical protein
MGKVAYALREELAGTVTQVEVDPDSGDELEVEVPAYTGGLINIGPDDESGDLDVRQALDEGDGIIVVDDVDPRVTNALDEYPPLKRVPVPAGREADVGWEDRKVPDLKAELERRGVTNVGNGAKAELVLALDSLDAHPLEPNPDGGQATATLAEVLDHDYPGAPDGGTPEGE